MEIKPSFPGIDIKQVTEYDSKTTVDITTENMTTMGEVDTSDLIMIRCRKYISIG